MGPVTVPSVKVNQKRRLYETNMKSRVAKKL